ATSFIKRSQSDPVFITVAAPHPVPVSYTIIGFVATVFAAGGFLMARAKPWLRLKKPVRPAEQDVDDQGEAEPIAGGLVIARPGIVSTLRRAADDGFAGVVRDTVRGRPVSEATVKLVLGDVERAILSARDGSFALENLAPGEWRAEVGAAGHVTERFTVPIPHRGELRGARIDLVPVRERVFQLYRRAAEPILPEPRLWGIWSPRQVVDHVRAKRPSPALAELTDFVEEVYFSQRLSPETILETASARVDHAIRERARPQPGPAA
ncbi:MAG: carboxypeptidase-like regulatory domain-containing protein, partial [Kofleriaceae bacterium]